MKNCPTCAQPVQDGAFSCPNCGCNFSAAPASQPGGAAAAPAAAVIPPAYGPPPSSGKATASLVLGILGLLLFVALIGIPLAVLAIILGHLSLSEIKKSAGAMGGHGKAMAGLVMGYISAGMGVLVVPILIIAAIAIPNLLKSRMAANEASAVGGMRTIVTASINYQAQCSKYPDSLLQLGNSPENDCEHGLGLIDPVLTGSNKSGYHFAYAKVDDQHFTLNAEPIKPGNTGIRYFFADESGVIRAERDRPATAESDPLN